MPTTASAALAALTEITQRGSDNIVYRPPEMIPEWTPEYADSLAAALRDALAAGGDPSRVLRLLRAAAVDLDALPPQLLGLVVAAGLPPDADVGGGDTLLHLLLNHPTPPRLDGQPAEQQAAASPPAPAGCSNVASAAAGGASLQELLARGARPDARDAAGNTAMHMLVAALITRRYYPDPPAPPPAASEASTASQQGCCDAAPDLEDNDAPRAAYCSTAFQLLLHAGWSPGARNNNGTSVIDLLDAGREKYSAELSELRDPKGAAQTALAMLRDRAPPERRLDEFVANKISGVQAVADAIAEMRGLAGSAELPRQARSAGTIVLLWLLLLLASVAWMLRRA